MNDQTLKRGRGRPPKYLPEYAEQVAKLCEMGHTDSEIADFFNVNMRTISRWKSAHPEFCQRFEIGTQAADQRVKRGLYQRAVGYTYDAVKIFPPRVTTNEDGETIIGKPVIVPYQEHVPPDVSAAIKWLGKREPEEGWGQTDQRVSVTIEDNRTPDEMRIALIDRLAAMLGGGAPLIEGAAVEEDKSDVDNE